MIKFPLEYELTPSVLEAGRHWVTLHLKNIGTENLTGLDVKLNSLDAYNISVLGTGSYLSILGSTEEEMLPFQVSASRTGNLYVTVEGWKDGEKFHWESPAVILTVGDEVAELTSLFAMTEPYSIIGEKISCESTVRGLTPSEGLQLEFWADTPSGEFEELAIVETKSLSRGEEATCSAEIIPEEEGLYTIYAYLYEGVRRIGREVEYVYVEKA